MSIPIRVLLLVGSVVTAVFVMYSIRKSKMRIEDSLFWIVLSIVILLLGIFPQIAAWISGLLGFQATINFIYLFFIFMLVIKCFSLSRQTSEQEGKIRELAQQLGLNKFEDLNQADTD